MTEWSLYKFWKWTSDPGYVFHLVHLVAEFRLL